MPRLTRADAARILNDNFAPWVLDLGMAIEDVSNEGARLRLRFGDRLVRVGGTICGQALMAFADTAMVFAIAAASGGFRPMTTVSQTTNFMRPVANADVLAEARVLRLGRTLAFGEVRLIDAAGAFVAHVSSTYAILGPVAGAAGD